MTTEDTENTERENDLQCELAAWELLREAEEKYSALAAEHMLVVNKLAEERDQAREAFVIATDQMVIAQGKVREANKERDEAREQNAKLRDIADALAVALERLDALYRSEQDPEALMPRPDWLRRPLQMLDAELDQLKEEVK
jgi:predicted house-cleaning NTP pyrophosphatase (Maf/HAM1 superfamily)